jgi:hypothetical protein
MGTVNIGSSTYQIYGEEAAFLTYITAHSGAATARAATAVDKRRALVTAARSFDRQRWQGLATDLVTPQPLAWPRTGVTDREGQPQDSGVIPDDVIEGSYEWAIIIIDDPDAAESTPGTNTKRTRSREKVDVIEVESEVENFKSTVGRTARFPTAVMELVGLFLAGSDANLSFASGTDEVSQFTTQDTDFGFSGTGIDGGSNA